MKPNWIKTEHGWCIEASDLTDTDRTLPNGKLIRMLAGTLHRDEEGEVTHWTCDCDGQTCTIYND